MRPRPPRLLLPPLHPPAPAPASLSPPATSTRSSSTSSTSSTSNFSRLLLRTMARGATAAVAVMAAAAAAVSSSAAAAASVGVGPLCHHQPQSQRAWGWGSHHRGAGGSKDGSSPLCWIPPPSPSLLPSTATAHGRAPLRAGASPFGVVAGGWQPWRGMTTASRPAQLVARRAAADGGWDGEGGGGKGRLWRRAGALLVTSAENGRVKKMKALGKKKKERERENVVLLEGHRLLLDAVDAGHAPLQVLVCPEAFDAPRGPQLQTLLESLPASSVTLCTAPLVAAACDTVSPQGVVAVIPRPAPAAAASSPSVKGGAAAAPPLCLVMDGMQDPGNVGTLIRTAVACGVSEVMLVQGCDPWSPKALRSGMGATFKAPLVSEAGSWEEAKAALAARHGGATGGKATLQFVAADGGAGLDDYDAIDWTGPSVLVVGNEGNGLSDAVRAELRAGGVTGGRIPLAGEIESLNAGAAGAIILAEAARQRRRQQQR